MNLTNTKPYTLGSFFDGSGTCPLAAVMCGMEPVWASEIEPFPIAVTRARLPAMKHYGDITKLNGAELEPVDVITFGSPCQGLSIAGKQLGIDDDERSCLFFEAIKRIHEMREATNGRYPRYAVWENVPGAFSCNQGRDFHAVIQAFAAEAGCSVPIPRPKGGKWTKAGQILGDGYSIAWRCLDAQYWGVPQRRLRIFLIADFGGNSAPKILFERQGLLGNSDQSIKAWKDFAANALGSINRGGGTGDSCLTPWDTQSSRVFGNNATWPTLQARGASGLTGQAVLTFKERSGCDGGGKGSLIQTEAASTLATNVDQAVCVINDQGGAVMDVSQDVVATLRAQSHGHEPIMCLNTHSANDVDTSTNTCAAFMGGQGERAGGLGYSNQVSPTLKGGSGGGNAMPDVVYSLQGNMVDRDSNMHGSGISENINATLNTVDRHAVALDCRNLKICGNISGAIQAKEIGGWSLNYQNPVLYTRQGHGNYADKDVSHTLQASDTITESDLIVQEHEDVQAKFDQILVPVRVGRKYIVRRLTPLEASRLQGFPDWWCADINIHDPTEEDMAFWMDVFETYRIAMGNEGRPKTRKQVIKWLKAPYADSAKYKMWGNGMALPCVLFVIQGIAEALGLQNDESIP